MQCHPSFLHFELENLANATIPKIATAKLERSQGVKVDTVSTSDLFLASKRAALIRGLALSGETDANDKVFEMGLDFDEILDTLFFR